MEKKKEGGGVIDETAWRKDMGLEVEEKKRKM